METENYINAEENKLKLLTEAMQTETTQTIAKYKPMIDLQEKNIDRAEAEEKRIRDQMPDGGDKLNFLLAVLLIAIVASIDVIGSVWRLTSLGYPPDYSLMVGVTLGLLLSGIGHCAGTFLKIYLGTSPTVLHKLMTIVFLAISVTLVFAASYIQIDSEEFVKTLILAVAISSGMFGLGLYSGIKSTYSHPAYARCKEELEKEKKRLIDLNNNLQNELTLRLKQLQIEFDAANRRLVRLSVHSSITNNHPYDIQASNLEKTGRPQAH
jgi:putative Mn2+ efflux pump MntP